MGQARTWPRQATSSCGASIAPQRGAASKGRKLPPGERREGRRARLRAACAGGISVVCGCGRCGRVAWRAGLRVGVWGGGRTPLPMPRGRESAPSGSACERGGQPARRARVDPVRRCGGRGGCSILQPPACAQRPAGAAQLGRRGTSRGGEQPNCARKHVRARPAPSAPPAPMSWAWR